MSYPPGVRVLQEELWQLDAHDLRQLWSALGRASYAKLAKTSFTPVRK
jgi:hypothetical protein